MLQKRILTHVSVVAHTILDEVLSIVHPQLALTAQYVLWPEGLKFLCVHMPRCNLSFKDYFGFFIWLEILGYFLYERKSKRNKETIYNNYLWDSLVHVLTWLLNLGICNLKSNFTESSELLKSATIAYGAFISISKLMRSTWNRWLRIPTSLMCQWPGGSSISSYSISRYVISLPRDS